MKRVYFHLLSPAIFGTVAVVSFHLTARVINQEASWDGAWSVWGMWLMGMWAVSILRTEQAKLNLTFRSPQESRYYDVARKKILAEWVKSYFLNSDTTIQESLTLTRLGKLFTYREVVDAIISVGMARCPNCGHYRYSSQVNASKGHCIWCKEIVEADRGNISNV